MGRGGVMQAATAAARPGIDWRQLDYEAARAAWRARFEAVMALPVARRVTEARL